MTKRLLLLICSKIKSIFDRSISFSSRVEYSVVSKKAKVWRHCKLYHSTIDDYSYLGSDSRLIYTHVGKFCSIAGNCAIGMGSHSINNISTSPIFTSKKNGTGVSWTDNNAFEEFREVVIGNDVWIGQQVMVMGGVKIGDGAVIGAGAVVTKDIPPYAIVAGVPAKLIRYRFPDDIIRKLEESKWWLLEESVLKEKMNLFQDPLTERNLGKLMDINSENKDWQQYEEKDINN